MCASKPKCTFSFATTKQTYPHLLSKVIVVVVVVIIIKNLKYWIPVSYNKVSGLFFFSLFSYLSFLSIMLLFLSSIFSFSYTILNPIECETCIILINWRLAICKVLYICRNDNCQCELIIDIKELKGISESESANQAKRN